MSSGGTAHWDAAYEAGDSVSWFQHAAQTSLDLIESAAGESSVAIIDIGGGNSTLVDGLLDRGRSDVSVLDISPNSLVAARERLGDRAQLPHWIVADLVSWKPPRAYDVWHDRAVLHFLTADDDRSRYRAVLREAVPVGGHVVIGVFAEDGPLKCSGLDVRRYSRSELEQFLGDAFETERFLREDHQTPSGTIQHFNWILARRTATN